MITTNINITDIILSSPLVHDPFTHVLFDIHPLPPLQTFSFFYYFVAVTFGSPLLTVTTTIMLSILSREWWEHKSFKRELLISLRAVALASPFIALFLKLVFEQKIGFLEYDLTARSALYHYLIGPALYFLLSDAYFYWTHRMWHHPWLYLHSHSLHHSCRPTTTFAGTAADLAEILVSGHGATMFPVLVVPLHSKMYLLLILCTEVWTMYLHNYQAHVMPKGIYSSHDHNIHHYYGQANFNFGLFFQFWDRMMGTYKEFVPASQRLSGRVVVKGVVSSSSAVVMVEGKEEEEEESVKTKRIVVTRNAA